MINITMVKAVETAKLRKVKEAAEFLIKPDPFHDRVFPAFNKVRLEATGIWETRDGRHFNFGDQENWVRVHNFKMVWYTLDLTGYMPKVDGMSSLVTVRPLTDAALVAVYLDQ